MQKSQLELDKHILKISALVSAVFYPAYALMFTYAGHPLVAATYLIALLASTAIVLWGLHRKRPLRALQITLMIYFLQFSILPWFQGGLTAPALWWLVAVPPVCLLAGLETQGIAMSVLTGINLLALCIAAETSTLPEPIALWSLSELQRLVAAATSSTVLVTIMVLSLKGRRTMRMALDRARDDAMEAVNAKARFLANMSHEIRTPLNGLVGAADLLRLGSLTAQQRSQLLSLQQQSSKTVLALVDDILDWSKLKAGQMTIEARPLNVSSLVFGANQLFSITAFDKGIELTSSAAPDMPSRFMGDATRLRQIINNLVSNAVKFTRVGGVHIHVSIDKPEPPPAGGRQLVRIAVSDSGIGIAPRQRDSLFDEFAQADGTITRRFGGSGLGLAICQDLAKLMGGQIEVESVPGRGSTFSLVVPLHPGPSPVETGQLLSGSQHLDVVVACGSEGLARHVGTLLRELKVRYRWVPDLPPLGEFNPGPAHLLLIDAGLLPEDPDAMSARWRELERKSIKVVVMAPFSGDSVLGPVEHLTFLYKPIRRSSLHSILAGSLIEPSVEPDSQFDTLPALVSRHVLLVEDNPVNQIVCKAMLTQVGCDVMQADNGQEALDLLARMHFDVVLMDLQMPVMDGLTATRELRKKEEREQLPRTPVVVMTANTEADIDTGMPDGAFDGFLSKPFVIKQLANCLKKFPAHA